MSSVASYYGGSCCSLRQIIADYNNGLLNNDVGKHEKKQLGKLRFLSKIRDLMIQFICSCLDTDFCSEKYLSSGKAL